MNIPTHRLQNIPGRRHRLHITAFGEVNPLKYYLLKVQGNFFKSHSAMAIINYLWPLLPIALVAYTVTALVVRRKLE